MRPKTKFMLALAASATFALPQAAMAQKTVSGGSGDMQWSATQRLIGQTSTATAAAGGDPLYFPNRPANNSVVALIMDYGAGGRFICSGSLSADRRHIVTAAHCVSNGAGTANPLKTTAYFSNSGDPDTILSSDASSVAIDISHYAVNAGYTGEVIDQNDVAVLTLKELAPSFATGYDIDFSGNLTGSQFEIAGVGGRSTIGGAFGVNAGTGRLRQGGNIFDYAWGDSAFGGFFTDRDASGENFFGTADVEFSYISDFDRSGFAANDTACRIAAAVGAPSGFGCDTGIGAREVGVAGGDSGGPQFINGKLVSVTSYGLTFGTNFGDIRAGLNSSWGEFNGFVPLYIHKDFITTALSSVPEPASWAMMLAGFGMIGGAVRRSRKTVAVPAA